MNKEQLRHLLRAAAGATGETVFVERLMKLETRAAVKEKLERSWVVSKTKLEAERSGGYGDM